MKTITISVSDDRLLKLKEIATDFGVSLEDLVRISVEELLAQPEERFQQVVDYILNKNKELYRRLA